MAKEEHIHVMVGVLLDDAGRVLIASRPREKSAAGDWELPGGKANRGEGRYSALCRELAEELGIAVEHSRPLIRYSHRIADCTIDLDVWRIDKWSGLPRGLEGQQLKWVLPQNLIEEGLLSADAPVVEAIQLPSICAVTPDDVASDRKSIIRALEALANSETRPLLCLRQRDLQCSDLISLAREAGQALRGSGLPMMLNGDPITLWQSLNGDPGDGSAADSTEVAGIHVPARYARGLRERPLPMSHLLGFSCHDASELEAARRLGATYAFLGPVKETASHPGQPGMGWEKFEELVRDLPLPVYAIGGLGPEDLETAWAHGAQGIAAIRSLWPED